MEFGSFDICEVDEHNGVGSVEISQICLMHGGTFHGTAPSNVV